MVAQSKSDEIVGEIEDLDEAPSAETLLLSVVSGEGARGRTDRQVVTPWLKFLWETYRTVLEILRNNPKLEQLYAYTAQQAFKFCQQYNRKTEFRRLADILRNHLQGLNKQQGQTQGVTLSNPDTAQLLLEIRFAQLNVATQMELWQESFRSVEDVHNLMMQSKKSTPPEMMVIYYERLTQIFWQAKNYLFHAYSCIKYFNLLRKLKQEMTEDQVRALASQVLLAALSIPLGGSDDEVDNGIDFNVQREKNLRLATLLGFTAPVPRSQLLAGLIAKDILKMAYPELKGLYELLEFKISPLNFGTTVQTHLEFIRGRPELCVYAEPIITNSFRRVMQHIVPMFHNIKLTHLQKLVSFVPSQHLERLIVESVAERLFEARIDHKNSIIAFASEKIDAPELKGQLSTLSERFDRALTMIDPTIRQEKLLRKCKHLTNVQRSVEEEHHSILIRKAFIEKRKEAEEERSRRKQKEREEKARQDWEAAQRAAHQEAEEKQRLQDQLQEKLRKAKMDQLKKEMEDADPQEHFRQQVQKLREEKEDMEKRMKKLAKRLNHLERARREEERPALEKLFSEKLDEDKKYHQEQIEKYLQEHKQAHHLRVQEKKRLLDVVPHCKEFESVITARRQAKYEEKKAAQQARKEQVRKELLLAKERQATLMAQREHIEEQKRVIEDELRKKREEEEAKRRAEQEARDAAEKERQAYLDRQAEIQRERERAALKRQEEITKQARSTGDSGKWGSQERSPAKEESSWRARRERTPEEPTRRTEGGWRARQEERPRARQEEAPRRSDDSGDWRRDGGGSARPQEGGWRARQQSGGDVREEGGWRSRQQEEPRREAWGGREDARREGEEGGWRSRNDAPRRTEGESGTWRSRQDSSGRVSQDSARGGEEGGWRSKQQEGGWRSRAGARQEEGNNWRNRDSAAKDGGGSWRSRNTEGQ